MRYYQKHLLFFLFVLITAIASAQTPIRVVGKKATSANDICKGCFLITGNVVITQRGTKIKCNRAVWNRRSNSVDATGNVRIYRSDSDYPLHGDILYFDGNTSLARLRQNVYYKDEQVSFTTEKFNYNTKTEEGYYFDGGVVEDSLNTLISDKGYIFKNDDIVVKDSVTITTPDYLVQADSIKYNSYNETVYIIAPTTLYSDSSTLYAEGGYYDSKNAYAYLSDNAQMSQGSYTMTGDLVTFKENEKIGEGFGNIVINDTVQMLKLKGNYGYYDGNKEYAFMTDSAQALLYSGIDTLFAHADTLVNYKDTADIQYFSGYPNVRFFRLDVQGKCDSLVYSMTDSVIRMYQEPMIWSLWNQMSGEEIYIFNKSNRIDHLELVNDAFIVSREDSMRFNQVRGKTITGYIRGNDLRKIQVDGNAESIYYSREGQLLVGYNQTESSYLTIQMQNGLVNKLSMTPKANGMFYSLESKPYEEQFLRKFQWRSDLRPISPWDIFRPTPPEYTGKKRRKPPRR